MTIVKTFIRYLISLLGIELSPVSHAERIISAAGGFVAILGIFVVSRQVVGFPDSAILVASMGASAVLLFAVPHGQLSQPWAVLGGHLIAAFVGVTCAQLIANELLAASAAVGLAIGAMYYARCIHPPGGATALAAVIGGEATHALGYQYVATPVLINVAVILTVAMVFNYPFPWRRYPAYLLKRSQQPVTDAGSDAQEVLSHGDFVYALSQIDSFVDISEYDLLRIYELATRRLRHRHLAIDDIVLGGSYSNDDAGDDWSVRQIVDESPSDVPDKDMVIYKVVSGPGRRSSGCISRVKFARWARYRVVRDGKGWKRNAPLPPEAD
jgi:CBS-domain-containing membrane protein